MENSRILISCVNTLVSLVGINLSKKQAFWYCPSNILRSCGVCYGENCLYVSTDDSLQRVSKEGITKFSLPGKYEHYAHSVHLIEKGQLGIADTGNSQIHLFDGKHFPLSFSPIENWQDIPLDAIHLNDFLPWEGGLLCSAFSFQPFTSWKKTAFPWMKDGWGCLYYLRRFEQKTVSRIVATGLQCPHTLVNHEGDVYCCASASGDWIHFEKTGQNLLYEKERIHVTDSHFLRGALRIPNGWLLGGSSQRHEEERDGMQLYFLSDEGEVSLVWEGGCGEIYDILPWDKTLMPPICEMLSKAEADEEMEGDFPLRFSLPKEYQ